MFLPHYRSIKRLTVLIVRYWLLYRRREYLQDTWCARPDRSPISRRRQIWCNRRYRRCGFIPGLAKPDQMDLVIRSRVSNGLFRVWVVIFMSLDLYTRIALYLAHNLPSRYFCPCVHLGLILNQNMRQPTEDGKLRSLVEDRWLSCALDLHRARLLNEDRIPKRLIKRFKSLADSKPTDGTDIPQAEL